MANLVALVGVDDMLIDGTPAVMLNIVVAEDIGTIGPPVENVPFGAVGKGRIEMGPVAALVPVITPEGLPMLVELPT